MAYLGYSSSGRRGLAYRMMREIFTETVGGVEVPGNRSGEEAPPLTLVVSS